MITTTPKKGLQQWILLISYTPIKNLIFKINKMCGSKVDKSYRTSKNIILFFIKMKNHSIKNERSTTTRVCISIKIHSQSISTKRMDKIVIYNGIIYIHSQINTYTYMNNLCISICDCRGITCQ